MVSNTEEVWTLEDIKKLMKMMGDNQVVEFKMGELQMTRLVTPMIGDDGPDVDDVSDEDILMNPYAGMEKS